MSESTPYRPESESPQPLRLLAGGLSGTERKPGRWLAWFALPVLLAITLISLNYSAQAIPQALYERIHSPAWIKDDVASYRLKSEQDFRQTESRLQGLARKNPSDPIAWLLLGRLYETLDRPKASEQAYHAVLKTAQQNLLSTWAFQHYTIAANASLVGLFYRHHRYGDSEIALNAIPNLAKAPHPQLLQAINDVLRSPERADAHWLLAKEWAHDLRLSSAREELQATQRLSRTFQLRQMAASFSQTVLPAHIEALSALARYNTLAGDALADTSGAESLAIGFYERAILENPHFDWPYYELADLYYRQNRFKEAYQCANRLLTLNPRLYNTHLMLGEWALEEAQYGKAIAHFRQAAVLLRQFPGENQASLLSSVDNQLGYAYERRGEYAQARQHYYQALLSATEREGREAREDYEYAQAGLSRVKAALAGAVASRKTGFSLE